MSQASLTPAELQAIIFCRLTEAAEAGTYLQNRILGQIEGLLFALNGSHTSLMSLMSSSTVLDLAGIPYVRRDGDILETPDEWLKEHGFARDHRGKYGSQHPRFSEKW